MREQRDDVRIADRRRRRPRPRQPWHRRSDHARVDVSARSTASASRRCVVQRGRGLSLARASQSPPREHPHRVHVEPTVERTALPSLGEFPGVRGAGGRRVPRAQHGARCRTPPLQMRAFGVRIHARNAPRSARQHRDGPRLRSVDPSAHRPRAAPDPRRPGRCRGLGVHVSSGLRRRTVPHAVRPRSLCEGTRRLLRSWRDHVLSALRPRGRRPGH